MNLSLSKADLRELAKARISEVLTPEQIAEFTKEIIREQIGTLTLARAQEELGFKTVRKLKDWCRSNRVPFEKRGREWFIRVGDIAAAQEKGLRLMPDPAAPLGTRLSPRHAVR